jgi:hypothetical protein
LYGASSFFERIPSTESISKRIAISDPHHSRTRGAILKSILENGYADGAEAEKRLCQV